MDVLVVFSLCICPVITVVMVTVYPRMMPFWFDGAGGPHSIAMEVAPLAVALNLTGGPLGTVVGNRHVIEHCDCVHLCLTILKCCHGDRQGTGSLPCSCICHHCTSVVIEWMERGND